MWELSPYPGITDDSIIGPVVVIVSKLPTDNSSLIINGVPFTYSNKDSLQYYYYSTYSGVNGGPNQATFTIRNDSIWFENIVRWQVTQQDYYYYTGKKN